MTTCVVVKKDGEVAIAADSLVTFGDTRLARGYEQNQKIFQVGDSLIALAGTTAHFPVMRSLLAGLADECRLGTRDDVFRTFLKVHEKLKTGTLDLDPDIWTVREDEIEPVEYNFKWGDEFVNDLVKMAKHDIIGCVEITGEEGEHTRYVLRGGKVREYCGRTVYPRTPSSVYDKISKPR